MGENDRVYDNARLNRLRADFKTCSAALAAIGDETRQLIVTALIEAGCDGMRVGQITERTHLSRPAVSHHLKILRDAGIVGLYKAGTKHFYYLDSSGTIVDLKRLVENMERLVLEALAQRGEEKQNERTE